MYSTFCFQLLCAGHYYDKWVTDSDSIQSYNYILTGCFLLHVLMSIPIKIAKTIWNHDEKKLFVIGKFKKTINFGEMQTVWYVLLLLTYYDCYVNYRNTGCAVVKGGIQN